MSVTAGIDPILTTNVYSPKQPTPRTRPASLRKTQSVRDMNHDYKLTNTELKSDDTTFVDEFQARLKYEQFKSEMEKNIRKIRNSMASADVLNEESV